MTLICGNKLDLHWFRYWLVARSVPGHKLSYGLLFIRRLRINFYELWIIIQLFWCKKSIWKYCQHNIASAPMCSYGHYTYTASLRYQATCTPSDGRPFLSLCNYTPGIVTRFFLNDICCADDSSVVWRLYITLAALLCMCINVTSFSNEIPRTTVAIAKTPSSVQKIYYKERLCGFI